MIEGTLLKPYDRTDLAAAAVTQARVIGALTLREMRTTFGRTSMGYLWAVLGPVLMIAIMLVIFRLASRTAPIGDSIALFLATGVLTYNTYSKLANRVCKAVSSNTALFTFPIVKPLDAILARAFLETATALSVCFIVFGALWATGLGALPKEPLTAAAGFFAMALLGLGIGSINAVIVRFWPSWDNVFALMNRPLHFISGLWFLPELLPQQVLDILIWNPLLHGIVWFRSGFYTDYGLHTLDRGYLLNWGLATLLIGLAAERALRARGNDQ